MKKLNCATRRGCAHSGGFGAYTVPKDNRGGAGVAGSARCAVGMDAGAIGSERASVATPGGKAWYRQSRSHPMPSPSRSRP